MTGRRAQARSGAPAPAPAKRREAEIWGSAPWERIEHQLAPIHTHLLRVLPHGPGVRFLDLATGAGAVALHAARAGADVTGLDLAPRLVETARRRAQTAGLRIRFDVGDAEALPYPNASFDAVSSAMGIMLARDHEAIARELARVCRPGGAIAFSAWREGGGWTPITAPYFESRAAGEPDPLDFGRRARVQALFAEAFELRFESGDAPLTGPTGEEVWRLAVATSGPFKARVAALEPNQRERLHLELVDYLDRRRRDGKVHVPTPYVLTIGARRS
jgi:SAM-dependent methyltransferase